MAAADTNVLVRLLVADDPVQTPKAELFLAREKPLWISIVVLLETAWVLGSVYGFILSSPPGCKLTTSRKP